MNFFNDYYKKNEVMASFILGVFFYLKTLFFIPYDENFDKKIIRGHYDLIFVYAFRIFFVILFNLFLYTACRKNFL